MEFLETLDRNLFLLINGWNSPIFDHIMWFISGKFSWLPLYVLVLYALLKKAGKYWWLMLISIVLLITLADQISVKLFKEVFERYRPSHNLELRDMVHIVNDKRGGLYGFVSSHAANAFALAMFVALVIKKSWVTYGMFIWAALIAYSRVYLGVHYPADVFCGGLLGIFIGWLVYTLHQSTIARLEHKKHHIQL